MKCSFWVKSGETQTGPLISISHGWQRHRKAKMCSNDCAMISMCISVSHRPSAFCAQRRAWRTATWVQVETILADRRLRWWGQWLFLRLARIWQIIPPRTTNIINKLAIIRSLVLEPPWIPTPKSSPRYMDHRPPWRLWCFDTFWPWPCLPWCTSHPVAKKQVYNI